MNDKTKILCPKCKGKGEIVEVNWDYGILFPFAVLLGSAYETKTCDTCNGKGWINDR